MAVVLAAIGYLCLVGAAATVEYNAESQKLSQSNYSDFGATLVTRALTWPLSGTIPSRADYGGMMPADAEWQLSEDIEQLLLFGIAQAAVFCTAALLLRLVTRRDPLRQP